MKKNVYALIDTETADMNKVYDFGVIFFDKKGNILFERNYINVDVFYNDKLMTSAYYGWKKPLYEKFDGLFYTNTKMMMFDFFKNCEKYGVTHLLAYNLAFDVRALSYTAKKYTRTEINFNNFILIDIMRVAIELLINTDKYRTFCRKNNEFTPKGNYKSSAESVYRYVNSDCKFCEDHTALSDCYCEYNIFMKCLKQKKGISQGIKGNLWKLIQDKE